MKPGIYVIGSYDGEELSKPITTKQGKVYQVKRVAVKAGGLLPTIVEFPPDAVIPKDEDDDGNISFPVVPVSKTWDEARGRSQQNQIRFQIKAQNVA